MTSTTPPPTVGALIAGAHRRAVVTLDDGRSARLVYAPIPGVPCRHGRHPRVQLPSGAFLTVPADRIVEVQP